ncbi:MAG: F0F1 ATP synthase subunit delta [Clostridiaceae bacterium]|nr:F0F1 ATP synthase subunit delta [Clostridiaceae bacterium]
MFEYLDRRYALAYYQVAEEKGKVEEYLQELRELIDLIITNTDIIQLTNNPQISTSRKKELMKDIFTDKVNDDLISFINILIDKKRIHTASGILAEAEKIHLEKKNTLVAHVKTVIALADTEKEELVRKLKVKYNKNILLEDELDESIIGGVYIKIGDDIIDGTLEYKLNQIKELMLKNKLEVVKE